MLVPFFGLLLATTFFGIVGVLALRLAGIQPLQRSVLVTFVAAALGGALVFGAVYGTLFADRVLASIGHQRASREWQTNR